MKDSNKKSENAKERDYKYHEKDFLAFYEKIAALFIYKEDIYGLKTDKVTTVDQPEEIDLFGGVNVTPDITIETMDVFKRILMGQAVFEENNDLLVLLRRFHTFRYQ